MRRTTLITQIALIALSVATQALAENTNFNSGSDGSFGALNITSDTTLDLPTNGIFNCTTINVANGATLRFNRNALNTPVYLLATNDVTINGTIYVSGGSSSGRVPGAGGPGGFDGGWGGYGGTGFGGTGLGSDGQGPGGGNQVNASCYRSWPGAYGTQNTYGYGATYGNSLLIPLIGGSGGAGTDGNPGGGGAGGGGAILIASSTRVVVTGNIYSRGADSYIGSGSGGAIRLVAAVVTGIGSLDTLGGYQSYCALRAGSGRTRIDCLDGYAVRSLHANNTVSSRGAQMFVFPAVQPHLDIIQAAGQLIPIGSPNGVTVVLPKGATNAQTVVVRATNFTNDLPITVAVIPNDRPSTTYQALISLTNNPPIVSVPVSLAVDSTNRIMVWTTY